MTGLAVTWDSCASGAHRRSTSARTRAGVRWSASGNASGTGKRHAPVERNPARYGQLSPVAGLFSRLETRIFRAAVAMFTANNAVLPFPTATGAGPCRCATRSTDLRAFPLQKAG